MSVSPAADSRATTGVSAETLTRYGVQPGELFGAGKVAFRSVESVESGRVEVLLGASCAWLPRALISGAVRPGQWLRFSREGDAVRIEVDLRATLRAERRLAELFSTLS